MKDMLRKIQEVIEGSEKLTETNLKEIIDSFFENLKNHIDTYIGDYPTFLEPVYLEDNVTIGDDALLGPYVYIGTNSEIKDYAELSRTIIFDNVQLGENFKLENCIILPGSTFDVNNLNLKNCVLKGRATTEKDLIKIEF